MIGEAMDMMCSTQARSTKIVVGKHKELTLIGKFVGLEVVRLSCVSAGTNGRCP
jgi:hypothetical protein